MAESTPRASSFYNSEQEIRRPCYSERHQRPSRLPLCDVGAYQPNQRLFEPPRGGLPAPHPSQHHSATFRVSSDKEFNSQVCHQFCVAMCCQFLVCACYVLSL